MHAPIQAGGLRLLAPLAGAALQAAVVQPLRRAFQSLGDPRTYATFASGDVPAAVRPFVPRRSMPPRRFSSRYGARIRRARAARRFTGKRTSRSVRSFGRFLRRSVKRARSTRRGRGRYRGRVNRVLRARKRKSARQVLSRVVAPACLNVAQNLQMAVWSPGTALNAQPYGAHNSTGFNRWGMRTICNLQDPRLIYHAAEASLDGDGDDTALKVYSLDTLVRLSNRSALPVYVEVLKLKRRVGELLYTSGTAEWTFSLNGSGDLHIPQWDHPLTSMMYSALETIEGTPTAADVYAPTGGANIWSYTDWLTEYKVTKKYRKLLPPGRHMMMSFKRLEEAMLPMSKYYANEAVGSANRRLDHKVGNELLFVRIHGVTCANREGDGTEPRIGWAPSEILAEVRQQLCYQVAPEGWRKPSVKDYTPTAGFITGYTVGRAPYTATDVGRAGIAHVSATETSTAQVTA